MWLQPVFFEDLTKGHIFQLVDFADAIDNT